MRALIGLRGAGGAQRHSRPLGIAPCFVARGECGVMIEAVPRHALKRAFAEHVRTVHGHIDQRLSPPAGRDRYH